MEEKTLSRDDSIKNCLLDIEKCIFKIYEELCSINTLIFLDYKYKTPVENISGKKRSRKETGFSDALPKDEKIKEMRKTVKEQNNLVFYKSSHAIKINKFTKRYIPMKELCEKYILVNGYIEFRSYDTCNCDKNVFHVDICKFDKKNNCDNDYCSYIHRSDIKYDKITSEEIEDES